MYLDMKIKKLPFYWRLKDRDEANIVPDFFNFEFGFDASLQLIIEKRSSSILDSLETIYSAESNIGYLQDGNEIAKPYGTDFFNYICSTLKSFGNKSSFILEIGCGGCTVLEELKKVGYKVIGIDPSPLAIRAGKSKGINIINEFFPSTIFNENVGAIFHSDVLEHVADPVVFLKHQKKQLTKNGIVIISVPDATEGIEYGDISMAMHQHLNYFDKESLANTVEAAGLRVVDIQVAGYGGSLYCTAINSEEVNYTLKKHELKFQSFVSKQKEVMNAIIGKIESDLISNKTIGFYVPLRALPYVSQLRDYSGIRFFDDTKPWYNKSFDGIEIYIENMEDLERNPVESLYIMSLTFGTVIKNKIESKNIKVENVFLLENFFNK